MYLTIAERIVLLELLPKEGDWAAYKEIHNARMILSLTAEEEKKFEFKVSNGQATWNQEGQKYEAELPITDWMTTTYQEILRKKVADKKLNYAREASLYEKFVVNYDQV